MSRVTIEYESGEKEELNLDYKEWLGLFWSGKWNGKIVRAVTVKGKRIEFA